MGKNSQEPDTSDFLKNREYWIEFYKNNEVTKGESNFAGFVDSYISSIGGVKNILDIGCGNGRDSEFFAKYYNVTGIDISPPINIGSKVNYIKSNFADFNFKSFDVYYMRFFVHAIAELELDNLLSLVYNSMVKNSHLFIETRSIKGIGSGDKLETNFKSSIGEQHYRIHYSLNYLSKKIESLGIDIVYRLESTGLAKFKNDDPYVIRLVCIKNH